MRSVPAAAAAEVEDVKKPGNDLLSHPAAQAAPSARTGLSMKRNFLYLA
jgi:hypothetical protein